MAVDVGNSSTKLMLARLAGDGTTVETEWTTCRSLRPNATADHWFDDSEESFPPARHSNRLDWIVSSVSPANHQRIRRLAEEGGLIGEWLDVDLRHIDLQVDVQRPDLVGMDRLLAAQAARRRFPGQRDVVVIDCGTALTIDLVTGDNTFRGGVIIAGPRTNLRALAAQTAALPDLSDEPVARPRHLVGRSTEEAILAGAWLNGLGAIHEVVRAFADTLDRTPAVVGSGGGLGPWRDEFPDDWVIADNLVIEALLEIAARQLQKKKKSRP
jgi:pantothenate kinase type III